LRLVQSTGQSADPPGSRSVDLNLLEVLDALLQEGSVTGAARRLHLTPPAVSRALSRLRATTGDPLLVRAGRSLVPTPAAEGMRAPVHEVLAAAHDLLAPQPVPTDEELERALDGVFTIRAGADAAEAFGPPLLAAVTARAPRVRLRLVGEGEETPDALRDGLVDLDVGAPLAGDADGLHHEPLGEDTMVVVARRDGALARAVGDAADGELTPGRLAAVRHVNASRRGVLRGPLDDALEARGLRRTTVATAPGFAAACTLVVEADLVCLVPESLTRRLRDPALQTWPPPVPLPAVRVGQTWHRRTHTDPAHRWLRARVRETVERIVEPR
jgi:DNA-binding transcriptional LysR family regulator